LHVDDVEPVAGRSAADDLRVCWHEASHATIGRHWSELGGVTCQPGDGFSGLTWGPQYNRHAKFAENDEAPSLCEKIGPLMPAIGESRRNKQPTMAETMAHRPIFEAFCTDPNNDTLMMCAPGIFIAGVPREIVSHCSSVMAQLRRSSPRWDEGDTGFLVQILAFVALQALDGSLAESVAEL